MIRRCFTHMLRHLAFGLTTLGLAWSCWLPDDGVRPGRPDDDRPS